MCSTVPPGNACVLVSVISAQKQSYFIEVRAFCIIARPRGSHVLCILLVDKTSTHRAVLPNYDCGRTFLLESIYSGRISSIVMSCLVGLL